LRRHLIAVSILAFLPTALFAQNSVTVASGATYTYSTSTNTTDRVTSITNDDGSTVAYEYDTLGNEIGINVSVGSALLSVRYVQGWSGRIVYSPGLPAVLVNADSNGRTSDVVVNPRLSISESGQIEVEAGDWWYSPPPPSTAATLTYDTAGYLTQATLNGGLALQLATPDSAGVVQQTLFGSSGNILAQSNAVGSSAGVRVVPAQLDAAAAEFGFGNQWADTLTFQSTADGHLTIAYNSNAQPVLYMVNVGPYRVGFSVDGMPLFYDIEPNYEATAEGTGAEVSPNISGVAPNHIVVTASGHTGFYIDRPADGAIYSAWNEADALGNETQPFAVIDVPSSSSLTMHGSSDSKHLKARGNFIRLYQTIICIGGYCWTRTWSSEWVEPGTAGGGGSGGGGAVPPGGGGTPASKPGNQVTGDAKLRLKVDRALKTASDKLKDTKCQQLLGQKDAIAIANPAGANRTLLQNMNARGYNDPSLYLTRGLSFVAGLGGKQCPGGSDTKASTNVWSTTVAVCPALNDTSEGMAAVYLIHEMLHTLGLPEYPTPGAKTTQQITDEVRAACGG
jgi:YD repeat-containing protein